MVVHGILKLEYSGVYGMDRLINIKVQRIGDGCYRGFSDDISDLTVEGTTVWETLKAYRIAARQLLGADDDNRN